MESWVSEERPVLLFAEDQAHESFLTPLIDRVAAEEGAQVSVQVSSAQGGHGRAISELVTWQVARSAAAVPSAPDLLIVAIDTNCSRFAETRQEIRKVVRADILDLLVAACPEPHIERWYMADPESFQVVVGEGPILGPEKCARERYKKILSDTIERAGYPGAFLDGTEFARDLVAGMDLYRAGKNSRSLGAFIEDLRNRLRQLAAPDST